MYKKVLVPLDGSALAECALPHVKGLAKEGSIGKIILLHVVVYNLPFCPPECVISLNYAYSTCRDNILEAANKYLTNVQSQLVSEGITAEAIIVESTSPVECITDYSHQNNVALIIIATHGYTGIKKMMFGSVALGVLHHSHTPVLLIRPE